MRLIGTLQDERLARKLGTVLEQRGIDARIEASIERDWGSDHYGDVEYTIWIVNEDDLLLAKQYMQEFLENPDDIQFLSSLSDEADEQPPASEPRQKEQWKNDVHQLARKPAQLTGKRTSVITFYLIALCTILFLWTQFHTRWPKEWPDYIPLAVVVFPKLQKDLLFDYPEKFVVADKLLLLYGTDRLADPEQELPEEGIALLKKYLSMNYWKGLYPRMVTVLSTGETGGRKAPTFEKIRDGEVWRLFTPCLLHGDIFHLLFNMIWLAILGTQIESRIGVFRYLLFILISSVGANIAQYLMSGYNFVGFSGVVCGMIAFIWVRKRRAPWEGYLLQRATIGFIALYIFGMLALQVVSFALEVTNGTGFAPQIANTAHIAGGVIGAALGATRFGRWAH